MLNVKPSLARLLKHWLLKHCCDSFPEPVVAECWLQKSNLKWTRSWSMMWVTWLSGKPFVATSWIKRFATIPPSRSRTCLCMAKTEVAVAFQCTMLMPRARSFWQQVVTQPCCKIQLALKSILMWPREQLKQLAVKAFGRLTKTFCKAPWRREVPFSVIISFLPVLQGYSFRLQVSNCRADGCQWQNVSCFAFSWPWVCQDHWRGVEVAGHSIVCWGQSCSKLSVYALKRNHHENICCLSMHNWF